LTSIGDRGEGEFPKTNPKYQKKKTEEGGKRDKGERRCVNATERKRGHEETHKKGGKKKL